MSKKHALIAGAITGTLASALLAGGCALHNQHASGNATQALDRIAAATATAPQSTAKPPCDGTVVTVRWNASTVCDVRPPQRLDVVFDESFSPEAWGGDASMAAVQQECDRMGGRDLIGFSAERPDALVCEGVDY